MNDPIYLDEVKKEYVDYNNHMNDAAYFKMFSLATEHFMDAIGLDAKGREEMDYSIFTLESHVRYLKEIKEGKKFSISCQILQHDKKRIHLFLVMNNEKSEKISSCELMLIGINLKTRKPANFPAVILKNIENFSLQTKEDDWPKEVGKIMELKRKK